jgi:chaperonin GroEL
MGGVAILQVGGVTTGAIEARKVKAQRAAIALRLALEDGVVPGGGCAYIRCQAAVTQVETVGDERLGRDALVRALEEPLAAISRNAGYDPAMIVAGVKQIPPDSGFDARSGQMVDLWSAGILDPAAVLTAALEAAVSGATMALTTDVLVHRRRPPEVVEP